MALLINMKVGILIRSEVDIMGVDFDLGTLSETDLLSMAGRFRRFELIYWKAAKCRMKKGR